MVLRSSSEVRTDRLAAERPVRSLKLDREISSQGLSVLTVPGSLCTTILPWCPREWGVPWLDVGGWRSVAVMQSTHTKTFTDVHT